MLQCSKEYLTNEKHINVLVEQAKKVLRKRTQLYNRYTRKFDNRDVKVNLEYFITNIASGYFGGKAPTYTIKQETDEKKKKSIAKLFKKIVGENANKEEFQLVIDYIRDYNDDSSFYYDLVKDYFITGACYGLNYQEEDNIRYAVTSSRQTIAIYDYSTPVNKIAIMRIWEELDSDGFKASMVEVITDEFKYHWKNSRQQPKEYKLNTNMNEEVQWSLVPAIAIENPDNLGIFEPVLSLIDAFETIIENNKNIFEYNDDAKLMVKGYQAENPMFILDETTGEQVINPARVLEDRKLLEARVVYTPDKEGEFEWLIKQINDVASENHKKTLIELILMVVCIPNVTDTGFTNADNASALEKKFFPLEQVLIQADKQFKKELLALWENIIDRVNTKHSTNFDFSEIQIDLQRNMPIEKKEIVEMALKLRNIISDESVIRLLPFDFDVESELAKRKEQNEENMMTNIEMFKNQDKNNPQVNVNNQNTPQNNKKDIKQETVKTI